MAAENLYISLIQADIAWEDKEANFEQYERLIESISGRKEIVILPEMFATGFSMAAARLAENMEGLTINWMRSMAQKHRIILTGSVIIESEGKFYNRLVWMQPDGNYGYYDKRHLFGYAGEDLHYTPGDNRLIVQVNGWKICPLVCYDLRFPVWSRNQLQEGEAAYDVLLYVANWPRKREIAWKTLLQARAIENLSYCVGVNRVGEDGSGFSYGGTSSVFDPLGAQLWQESEIVCTHTIQLSRNLLEETRSHLSFLKDADRFVIP